MTYNGQQTIVEEGNLDSIKAGLVELGVPFDENDVSLPSVQVISTEGKITKYEATLAGVDVEFELDNRITARFPNLLDELGAEFASAVRKKEAQ